MRLSQAIQAFLEEPPRDIPDELLDGLGGIKEKLDAPKYTSESPGEQSAREVAESMAARLEANDSNEEIPVSA